MEVKTKRTRHRSSASLTSSEFANHEIVTLAVYLLGGDSHHVETEDIAVRVNEIAPRRFTWRKYPDQINIENVRTFLSDAKKLKNGGYLRGTGKDGWLLTEDGLAFAKRVVSDLNDADLSRTPRSQKERQWVNRERARMLSSDAFSKFQDGRQITITSHEAESFFRLDDYVLGKARENKIVRILNTFSDDPLLGAIVRDLAGRIERR